jgi:hypothetical protein
MSFGNQPNVERGFALALVFVVSASAIFYASIF